jgi:hypothetical protein
VRNEVWYDSRRSRYVVWTTFDGESTGTVSGNQADPAVAGFLDRYRRALATGAAKVVRTERVGGRKARILRFALGPGDVEEVAVDATTYRPLWLRSFSGHPARSTFLRVLGIESSSRRPRGVRAPKQPLFVTGGWKVVRSLRPFEAARALGLAARWPGRRLDGVALAKIQLVRLTTLRQPGSRPLRRGPGLVFGYGSSSQWLMLDEAPTPQAGFGFESAESGSIGPLPPPGSIRLSCDSCGPGGHAPQYHPIWTGQLHEHGLYVQIRSWSRELVLRAARSLRPLP